MRLSRGAPLAALAVLSLALPTTLNTAQPGNGAASFAPVAGEQRPSPRGPSIHSSDGVRGPLLDRRLVGKRASARGTAAVSWRVVPGLRYRSYSVDEPQGRPELDHLHRGDARTGLWVVKLRTSDFLQKREL